MELNNLNSNLFSIEKEFLNFFAYQRMYFAHSIWNEMEHFMISLYSIQKKVLSLMKIQSTAWIQHNLPISTISGNYCVFKSLFREMLRCSFEKKKKIISKWCKIVNESSRNSKIISIFCTFSVALNDVLCTVVMW